MTTPAIDAAVKALEEIETVANALNLLSQTTAGVNMEEAKMYAGWAGVLYKAIAALRHGAEGEDFMPHVAARKITDQIREELGHLIPDDKHLVFFPALELKIHIALSQSMGAEGEAAADYLVNSPDANYATPPKAGDAGELDCLIDQLRDCVYDEAVAFDKKRARELIQAYGDQRWTDAREGAAEWFEKEAALQTEYQCDASDVKFYAGKIRAMRPGDGG